jgi:hypothetical protein
MTTSITSQDLRGNRCCAMRSTLGVRTSSRQLGRCYTPRTSATNLDAWMSRTSCCSTSARLCWLAATGFALNTGLLCRRRQTVSCTRWATATLSHRDRPPSRIGRKRGHWRRSVGTDLGEFRRGKIPAQVWLALARRRVGEPEPRPALTAGTSFAVKAEIRPPYGQSPRLSADLVKGIIDGVVSAFQAHTDTSTSGEVAARLANLLPADPAEIEDLLLERRWAVLGPVPRLVYLRNGGVQWNPGDDWCDAGELLAAEPKQPTRVGRSGVRSSSSLADPTRPSRARTP